ncbi:hypothetical protein ACLOJK_012983 [Asimina triloba]
MVEGARRRGLHVRDASAHGGDCHCLFQMVGTSMCNRACCCGWIMEMLAAVGERNKGV